MQMAKDDLIDGNGRVDLRGGAAALTTAVEDWPPGGALKAATQGGVLGLITVFATLLLVHCPFQLLGIP
jgi:hypothetical protein